MHRGVPALLVRQPGARAPGAGDRARGTPGARGLAVVRGGPRVSRVRANRGHRLRRLHQATVGRYLADLARRLEDAGVPAPLQIMQSRGGLASADIARGRPVRLFLSGPAAG